MFTETQLNLIREVARKKKNQGELSVYTGLDWSDDKFTDAQLNIIKYCAEECKRQHSGEMSVYWMVNAWNTAMLWPFGEERDQTDPVDLDIPFISMLGSLVEPNVNAKGFRTVQVGVNTNTGFKEFIPYYNIERSLEYLLVAYYENRLFGGISDGKLGRHMLAQSAEDQFYFDYEQIHPFRDGNGRSGKIIYNYLRGTLDNPILPPNFFADEGGIP